MKTKIKNKTKMWIAILSAIIFTQMLLLGFTFAWLTDKKSDEKTLDFGNIKLKAGENGTSTSMGITLTRADGTTVATKALPGDKIKVTIGVELESTSQPAYYLVYLDDANMFSCDKEFFFKNGDTVYATDGTTTNKLNQDGTLDTTTSTEVVGKIEANQTHTIEFIQQIDKTKTEKQLYGTKEFVCTVYAIQQANISPKDAFTEIYNKEYATVNFLNGADLQKALSGSTGLDVLPGWQQMLLANNISYKSIESMGFYREYDLPSTVTYNETLTNTYNGLVANEDEKGLVKVYTSPSNTELAFSSERRIQAPENCIFIFGDPMRQLGADTTDMQMKTLKLNNFYTDNTTMMCAMFCYSVNLESLDLHKFNTSNVMGFDVPYGTGTLNTGFGNMFQECRSLKSLDLSNFDTSNVTGMSHMFYNCSLLTSLDLSNFNISNVTDIEGMFTNCTSLTSLDLSNFDTSKVTNMSFMFNHCSSLTSLDLSNFDTSNVTDMTLMFSGCNSLTTLDVSNFDFSKLTSVSSIFSGLSKLETLKITNVKVNATMSRMFYELGSLTNLDLSNFNTSNVTNMDYMFYGCSSLTILDLSNFDTSNVTNMGGMFRGCSSLTTLDLSSFNTSNVTNMDSMFNNCSSLTSLDLSSFNTSNVTDMRHMFSGCSLLTSLDLSNFDTSKVTNMENMFSGCSSLTILDLSNFDTSNVTDMKNMFAGCFADNPSGSELKIGDNFKYNGTVVTAKSTLVSNARLNSNVKVTKNGVEI